MSADAWQSSEEEEEELTLSDAGVVEKYKLAGNVVNTAMAAVIALVKVSDLSVVHGEASFLGSHFFSLCCARSLGRPQVGARVVDLCEAGDALLVSEANKHFPKKKQMLKGIAFPTCVSVNNVCGHFSPAQKDDKTVLAEGDLVKIDMGAHVDGYVSVAAHTTIATDKPTEVVGGRAADVICAAYFASEAALHLMRAGNTNAQVTEIFGKVGGEKWRAQ